MMRNKIVFSLLCMLCITSVALSGIQTVKNIAFSLPGTFYYVNSQFMLNATGSADIQTYDSADYNYTIKNLAIDILPCDLKQNRSSGGRAIGDFAGGGSLTVTGDLMRRAADGSTYGDVLYSGTILIGNMVKTSLQTWTLAETVSVSSTVSASLALTGSNGGLNSGISFDTNKMIIGDMSLKLQFYTPGIEAFGTTNYQAAVAPVVQIAAALPEPATMLLLVLGGLGLLRRGK